MIATRLQDTLRVRAALVLFAVLPLVTGLVLVRPADGQVSQFGLYAVTADGGPSVLGGDIGAGGGLAVVDGGAPYGALRLDSSPSSSAKAAAVEPGTLFRTIVGVINTEAGEEVVHVPTAEASYPGDQQESDGDALGSAEESGGRLAGATAHVEAHAYDAMVRAEGGQAMVPGAWLQESNTLDITAAVDPAAGTLHSRVVSRAGQTSFGGGVFVVESVVGIVTTAVTPEGRLVKASTSASGASVNGIPVVITEEGVVVDGTPTVPGGPLADAQDAVNSALGNAGIEVVALAPREEVEGGSMVGDSGGVRVTIHTAPSAAAPGNTLVMTLGKATATSYDEPPAPALPPVSSPVSGAETPPASTGGGTTTTSSPGFTSAPSAPSGSAGSTGTAEPAPLVAAPTSDASSGSGQLAIAGKRLPARLVLAAFGGWQLLSLSSCTLAVFALRGEDDEDEDEGF